MKTKKVILLVVVILGLISCGNEETKVSPIYVKIDTPIDSIGTKFSFTENYEVPIKDGFITKVSYKEDILYSGDVKTTILAPKINSKDLKVVFTKKTAADNIWSYSTYTSGTLLFEDLGMGGDQDYNDFVSEIQLQTQVNQNPQTGLVTSIGIVPFGCYPKALGNILPIGLGIDIIKKSTLEIIHTSWMFHDIRKEIFNNQKGFINTEQGKKTELYNANKFINDRFSPENLKINDFTVEIFLEVRGKKLYTSSATFTPTNKFPDGFLLPGVFNFRYPRETSKIFLAYPKLTNWINGISEDPFSLSMSNYLY